ncbi:MAG TPA: hypothetical protein VEV87_00280 [Chitinophagaceae bacterium]|nr:hypothetical protein [Chitinophagaceae bacterium]
MKKWLVGSIVGAILLFLWQFISWSLAGLHDKEFKYVEAQDQLMSTLSSTLKEDGQYMLPQAAPGASNEEKQKLMEQMAGKPYAMINYKAAYKGDMITPMIRSFFVDLVIILLLIFVVGRTTTLSFGSVWMGSLAVGFVGWLWYPYTQNIWFQTPIEVVTGALMDWFIAFSIVGLWLGFWLPRTNAARA